MDILNNNLELIPQIKEIYEKLKDDLYHIEITKDQNYTLKLNNIYFHSKYDPLKKTDRIIEMLLKGKEELNVIIVFGAGLCFIVKSLFEKLLKNNKSSIKPYIIYIEKDINIFLTSINYYDWSDIIKNENVKLFLSAEKEIIGSFIQTIPTKKIRYYYHRPSFMINEEYYKEVQNYINYVLDRKDMNSATFKRFQRPWAKNLLHNLPPLFFRI